MRTEPLQGKGNVMRRMFADIDVDIDVMVVGDDTYSAECAPAMVNMLLEERLDMVNGRRVADSANACHPGHRFGNTLLTRMVVLIFGNRFSDILSVISGLVSALREELSGAGVGIRDQDGAHNPCARVADADP